jgi:hypothetical protein
MHFFSENLKRSDPEMYMRITGPLEWVYSDRCEGVDWVHVALCVESSGGLREYGNGPPRSKRR